MTHGQSVDGGGRLIVSVPVPAPAAQPRRPAGTITRTRDARPGCRGKTACSTPAGADGRMYAEETHEKK